jgi:ribose transport system ATP-binding protein
MEQISKDRAAETSRLEMRNISKRFGAVTVLNDISLSCEAGEVHAICGENGAGKSTLMKILAGLYRPEAGEIFIDGNKLEFRHPLESQRSGVAIIHQELSLLPHRSVAENMFLGREPVRYGLVQRKQMRADAARMLERLQSTIDPDAKAGALTIADQQMVEIAKALTLNARILVFDEPTAALDSAESAKLFAFIGELKNDGVAIVYISHRMAEVFALADRLTVIKDGRKIATALRAETSSDTVVRQMVGRDLGTLYPARIAAPRANETILEVEAAGNDSLAGISLKIKAGEIVGVAGLDGSGKSALARALTGDAPFETGVVKMWDDGARVTSPRQSAQRGIAYIPEDRKSEGLGLRQSLRENTAAARRALSGQLATASSNGCSNQIIDELLRRLDVRAASFGAMVGSLSGGNQQKVVIARWLAVSPRLWVLCEPTRGVDVGAKLAIYTILRGLADAGAGVLVVSSDLTEIIGISDRILVMSEGRIAAECEAGATEEELMKHAVSSHSRKEEFA